MVNKIPTVEFEVEAIKTDTVHTYTLKKIVLGKKRDHDNLTDKLKQSGHSCTKVFILCRCFLFLFDINVFLCIVTAS